MSYKETLIQKNNDMHEPCSICGKVHHLAVMEKVASGDYVCPDCLDEHFVQCDSCGEYYKEDELTEVNGGEKSYCIDCVESECTTCDDCGMVITKEGSTRTDMGYYICESCYENNYFTCDSCNEACSNDDLEPIYDANGNVIEYVCRSCAQRHYYKCDNCGKYFERDNVVIGNNNITVCEDCYERCNYAVCDCCGDLCSEDNWSYSENRDAPLCHDCYDEEENAELLDEYSHKPEPHFIHCNEKSKQYGGVENELSFDDTEERNEALEILNSTLNDDEKGKRFYFKKDSSLYNGAEIVSHPATLNAWLELKPRLAEAFESVSNLTDGHRDGLHIHLAKGAMSDAHKVRFGSFIHALQDQIVTIARRPSCDWAKYHAKPTTGKDALSCEHNYDRYEAVNWKNSKTVELRIFRSTINVTEFYASIEFAFAAYWFTKSHCSIAEIIRNPDKVWLSFLSYIRTDSRFVDLCNFLKGEYANPSQLTVATSDTLTSYLSILTAKATDKGNKATRKLAKVS